MNPLNNLFVKTSLFLLNNSSVNGYMSVYRNDLTLRCYPNAWKTLEFMIHDNLDGRTLNEIECTP
jgi:hypothetical protein